jgi:outer membrane protein assembly factor BamB
MTQQPMPLERMVAGWMVDEATGAPEALLDQILATTTRTQPQPRIVALVAEPTLRGRTTRAAVGLPNRGLVLATVLALVLAALAGLAVGAYLLFNEKPAETADWPGFRGTADRQPAGLTGPVGNPVAAWDVNTTGGVLEIAVIGDRVYFASDDGRLHGLTRDRGIEQWSVEVAEPPLTGPYAADGRLYLSDANGRFHARAQADGAPVWTSPTAYRTPSRSVVAAGSLVFGTGDGFVVALDSATGTEQWRVAIPGATEVDAPAFADGRVFAGTQGGGFVAIDVATHAIAWTGDTHGELTGSATVAGGIAYIAAGADPLATGSIHAFDAATGRALWTGADVRLGFPTVAEGVAYSASIDGLLEALDTATGAARWKIQLTGDTRSPVVVGGVVYLSGGDAQRVYAIDAATGRELWEVPLAGTANCCVSVAKGMLFVGNLSGQVLAIAGDGAALTGRPVATPPAGTPGVSAPASSGPSATPIPSSATLDWTTDLRSMGFAPVCQIAVDPTTGNIWAPQAETGRIAIYRPDGSLLEEWGEPGSDTAQFDFRRGNGDGYGTLAFEKDGSFFVLDVGNHRIQQFDAHRRFVRAWGSFGDRPKEYDDPVGIAVAPDGSLWVLDDHRSIVEHYTASGELLGAFDPFATEPVNGGANSLAIDSAGNLYVSGYNPNQVYVFSLDGTFIRAVGRGILSEQAGDMAIDAAGRLYVSQGPERGDRPGVLVFAPDGALVGGFGPPGSEDGQIVFPGGIALDGTGGVYIEDSLPETARLMRFRLDPTLLP